MTRPQQLQGATQRDVDVTPLGWTPPTESRETAAVLDVLFGDGGPNKPAGVFRGFPTNGYRLTLQGLIVECVLPDTVPAVELHRRAWVARNRLYAVRQQQQLERLHESSPAAYDEARAEMLGRAERAMRAVRSRFTAEHPVAPAEPTPSYAAAHDAGEICVCGYSRLSHGDGSCSCTEFRRKQ